MTPCQKLQRDIVLKALSGLKDEVVLGSLEQEFIKAASVEMTAENVTELYWLLTEFDGQSDIESDFRRGQIETDLPCKGSRHFSSKSVAAKLSDGTWVGWTYWFGGGKHGEPGGIDWMGDAYDLNVIESERLVKVLEFKRADGKTSLKAVLP